MKPEFQRLLENIEKAAATEKNLAAVLVEHTNNWKEANETLNAANKAFDDYVHDMKLTSQGKK